MELVRILCEGLSTQGTKVLLPSGEELKGISKIVLTAVPNALWQAEITLNVQPPELGEVEATIVTDVPDQTGTGC